MSNTQAELYEYLKANNLNAIFVSIVEAILVEKPDNPIGFMTKFLLDKFPEETKGFSNVNASGPPKHLILAAESNEGEELSVTESDDETVATDASVAPASDEQPRRKKRRESIFAEKIDDDANIELKHFQKSEVDSSRILQMLTNNLFFSHLDSNQMDQVVNAMFLVEKQERDIIINQGDDGDNFYLVDEGAVDVFITTIGSNEDAKLVKTCEKGDSFGELAIMYNAPRAVSRAVDGCISSLLSVDLINLLFYLRLPALQKEMYGCGLSTE